MRHSDYSFIGILIGTTLAFTVLAGCGKDTGSMGATAKNGAPAPAVSPLDPRIQSLADAQAKGREADAKKQAAAMRQAHTP